MPDPQDPGCHYLYSCCRARGKIQIMSDEKRKKKPVNFVICDVQEEYIDHLFQILSEQMTGAYQFQLFHDPEQMVEFAGQTDPGILLIGEECIKEIQYPFKICKKFILTETPKQQTEREEIPVFRYQSAGQIINIIENGIRESGSPESGRSWEQKIPDGRTAVQKKSRERIRDEPQIRGMIGVYSPVHRIGKTRFAMRLGRKMAMQVPVLYLNLEGYSGGSHYFPEDTSHDLGDLIYCLKQERTDYGLKISSMTGQYGNMDYIMPMENESDLRAISGEEWIRLFDRILEKCIYEILILDLGDCINGLYDILKNCERVYTPYICEGAAMAKVEQYEKNLRTTGYGDVLSRTVKRQMKKKQHDSKRAVEEQ